MVYEGKEPYIFVSYAHRDGDTVLPAIRALQSAGYRVWFDQGIEAGTEWPEYIAEHLEACECFVAFLSENAVKSVNCRQEINLACDMNKNILVVYLEEVVLTPGMRLRLGTSQAMFKNRCPRADQFHQQLCSARILGECRNAPQPSAEKPAAPKVSAPVETPKPVAPKSDPPPQKEKPGLWARKSFLSTRMILLELLSVVVCSIVIHKATAAGLSFWPLVGVVVLPRAVTTLLNYVQELTYRGSPKDSAFETVTMECFFVPLTCIVGMFCVASQPILLKILIGLGFGVASALAALVMVILGEILRDNLIGK